jgi:hypothetical protein
VTPVNRSLPALDRRRFLATAGSGAALAAAGVVTAPTSGAAHAQTSTGAVDVITVDGAIPGIPYRTRTSILDVAEYARRAQVNSAAFTNAWTRALQRLAEVPAPADSPASGNSVNWRPNSGVVIRVDPGFYAIDQWSMATRPADLGLPGSESEGHQYGEWSVRITIEAEGVVLVAKDHQGTSVGSPVVYLGNPDSPGGSRDLLKRVTLRGLTVQSDGDSLQGGYVADRIGMLVHQSQEIRLEQVSVFGFAREGIRLEGVMDSTIDAAVVGWCGRPSRLATAPDPLPFGLSLASTRDSSGAILENCNAVRVIDSHLEFCEQELYLDRGTRHVEFIGCKFEHGWGTTSAQSPISIGSPANTRSAHDRVLEIGFTSCMFVQNTYVNAGSHPSHIVVGEVTYGGGEAAAAKTAITFSGCHFSVPDGGGERWFTGGDTTFVGCDFAGCGNAEGEPPCFDLGNDVTFDDCRFAAVAELHDGVTGSRRAGEPGAAVPGSRADLFRFRGGASRVINPVIYFPPPTEGVHTSPGSVATLAGGAGDANRIAGWHPAFYGLPGDGSGRPGPIAAVRYEETGRTQLGSSLVWEAMSGASTPVLEPDAQGRVSVCGREQIRVQGGRTYRGFTDAYAGQVVRVVADGEPITFVGGSLVLKGTQTLRAGIADMTSFVFYTYGSGSAWFQL